MGADSAWAWELATNRFTAVLWETVLDSYAREMELQPKYKYWFREK